MADHGTLRVVNISDPEDPMEVGCYDTTAVINSVTVSGDHAYIAGSWWGEERFGLHVIRITDPENPEEVGNYYPMGSVSGVAVSGDYAYLAMSSFFADNGGLRIVDITDPENPEEVGHYYVLYAYDVSVSGDYAFLAGNEDGLRVINISDPEQPHEVGYYDTPGYALRVDLSDAGLIYVAERTNMGVFRFTDPAGVSDPIVSSPVEFMLLTAYPNPFNSTTTISYNIPSTTNITIELYNLLGQRVLTLFEGHQQVGTHSTLLTADYLPSGLYFVRLSTDNQLSIQKVMLVK